MQQRFHVADPALEGPQAGTFGPCSSARCADPHEDQAECEERAAALELEGEAYGHTQHRDHQTFEVKGEPRSYLLVCDHAAHFVEEHRFTLASFDGRQHVRDHLASCDCELEEWEPAAWSREARRLKVAGQEQKDRRRPAVGTGNG